MESNKYIVKCGRYLIGTYKALNKNMNDAINMAVWYAANDFEQKGIEQYIKYNW